MVSAAVLVRQVGSLGDALDRLATSLLDHERRREPGDRELIEIAAHDVLRAWVQTRRRAQEMERAVADAVLRALDRAGRILGAAPSMPALGMSGGISPHQGVAEGCGSGDTRQIRRLQPVDNAMIGPHPETTNRDEDDLDRADGTCGQELEHRRGVRP